MRRPLLVPLLVIISCALLVAHTVRADAETTENNPLARAGAAFEELTTYSATLRSYAGGKENIRFYYKKPGFVRMEFISPHKGALLVYSPETAKARLRPFGLIKPLMLTLSPSNRLIKSPQGHTVDRSHIGALIENARILEGRGSSNTIGLEEIKGRLALLIEVIASDGFELESINRYLLWLDIETGLPVKVEGYDSNGKLVEGIFIDDLILNVSISNSVFSP